jgi:hypothetical protein
METKTENGGEGAVASFAFDRGRVERFREAFPRARWKEEEKRWFVPGKTAGRRIARWLDQEADLEDVHGEIRGRDAFAFEPIISPYLQAAEQLVVRTPFSRTVVRELRQVPFASWDDREKVWRVPYASYDDLRRRWPVIEAAARRNEPEARRETAEAVKGSEEHRRARERTNERRKHRHPLDPDHLPDPDRPVATEAYGIVVFTGHAGELAEKGPLERYYPSLAATGNDYVWCDWRLPTLEELVSTWPARQAPDLRQKRAGWWPPTKPELVEARKQARSRERRRET